MKYLYFIFLGLAISWSAPVVFSENLNLDRNQFSIGPEWYYAQRTKEGGTKQDGNLFGVYLSYDRLKRYGCYWGGDINYAEGTLDGHSRAGRKLRSRLLDACFEGRLGFTFQQQKGCQVGATPFIGIGYFIEENNFINPSPIPAHFKTRFTYFTAGFLTQIHFSNQFEMGLNFKAKVPFAPRCKVSNDPDNEPVDQRIGQRFQYQADFPITYYAFCKCQLGISMTPFYEYRNYGSHPNFPFNFIKTHFNIWGIKLGITYRM